MCIATCYIKASCFPGGAISVLDLPAVDIRSAMQSFNLSQLDEFSVVYISESIQHTMVNNTPFDYYKLRFSIGVVLILLGGHLLLLSLIRDYRKNAEEVILWFHVLVPKCAFHSSVYYNLCAFHSSVYVTCIVIYYSSAARAC